MKIGMFFNPTTTVHTRALRLKSRGGTAGFTIIEVLFSAAFLALFTGVLITAYILYFRIATAGPQHTAAVFLADEGLEAVRVIRDGGWEDGIAALDTELPYHLIFQDGLWSATTDPQLIDDTFTRTVTLYEVRRDSDDNIADTGEIDDGTLRADVLVSWSGLLGESEVELSTYVANLFD